MDPHSTDIGAISSGNLHQIFSYLEPRDLCFVSATCKHWRLLSQDQASSKLWKSFYKQRWLPTLKQDISTKCWQSEYGSKMKRVNSWHHKHYQQDNLYGHNSAVHCLGIIPGCHLVATGSTDRTVKIWDMQAGTPLASSRLHGGPVRCLAVDQRMLVSGSSDHKLRVWLGTSKSKAGFDLTDPIKLGRSGHTGPIAAVALDSECIYSGSWDYTMRVWQRSSLQLAAIVPFDDWVFSLASRGGHVLAGLSSRFHVLDQCTLQPLKQLYHQAGGVLSLEGSQDGRMAYSGGHDGRVVAHDLRLPDALPTVARIWSIKPSNNSTKVQNVKYSTTDCRLPDASSIVATLWETSSGVRSLSLEDPWLAAALGDGSVAMLQTDAASKHAKHGHAVQPGARSHSRLFQMPQGTTCCVDLSDQWLVAGSDSGIVSSWDFSRAEEKAQEVQAAKAARGRARQQRAEKHSSRLAHQREKAALALAALQALHPDAEAREAGNAEGSIESSLTFASPPASTEHADTDAACRTHCASIVLSEACDSVDSTRPQEQSSVPSTATADLAHVHSLPVMSNSPSPPLTSKEMTVHPYSHSHVASEAKPIPLRRHASVAGTLNTSKLVPSPLTPGYSAGCQTNSPNSMTSWQIVRPRPVQRDRSTLKASKHVHVQA